MAQQSGHLKSGGRSSKHEGELVKRVVSALVLGPLVLAALYFGSPFSDVLIVAAGILMVWEWASITGKALKDWEMITSLATLAVALFAAVFHYYQIAVWVLLAGAGFLLLLSRQGGRKDAAGSGEASGDVKETGGLWLPFGILYLGLACLSFLWLRALGFQWIFLLLIVVWVTDSAAYFTGRKWGKRKLAPKISPGKTWEGLWGGVLCAGVAAPLALLLFGVPFKAFLIFSIIGAGLAAISQAGDLLESYLKRRHGVKDSSKLIPGHGGILDRTDGLLAAGIVLAAILSLKTRFALWAF